MIKKSESLSIAEAQEFIAKDNKTDVLTFIKKFDIISTAKAKELRKKIEGLDSMKINEKQISKLIDLLPEDKEDLNKIFVDTSLDEDETNKILETIKEFK
jgi:DNA-directed RNA polymerase subunit F